MVIDFNLSPIPETADIEKAVLSIFFIGGDTAVENKPNVCSLYTIVKEWKESEVTWDNADEDTKWKMLDFDTKFYNPDLKDTVSSPGGCDYNPGPVDIVDYSKMNSWENYNVTDVIKEAIEEQKSFYGFMIKQFLGRRENEVDNTKKRSNQGKAYYSSEYIEVDKRPKLTVKYTSTGIKTVVSSKLRDKILLQKKGNKIAVFIPFEGINNLVVFDLHGKIICSLSCCNKGWIDFPVNRLSSGINILTIETDQKTILKKFSFVQ